MASEAQDAGATAWEARLAAVRARAAERRRRQPLERLEGIVRQDLYRRERVLNALAQPGFALVAECRRRSPAGERLAAPAARGALARGEERDWFERAALYAAGGARIVSVATEEDALGGRLADLRTVEHVALPRLRRDLVLDEGMLLETMVYGADLLLLSPRALPGPELARLDALARELGLARLHEVHDVRELERALELEPELVGVRARDVATHALDPGAWARLLPRVPARQMALAVGGVSELADLRRARDAGARGALVAAALMRAADPAATLRGWIEGLA